MGYATVLFRGINGCISPAHNAKDVTAAGFTLLGPLLGKWQNLIRSDHISIDCSP